MKVTFRRVVLLSLPFVLVVMTLLSGGCDKETATPGGSGDTANAASATDGPMTTGQALVGIVDMDEIAKELGLMDQLSQILNNRGMQLQEQVNTVQIGIQSAMEKKIKEFGDEPSDEQKRELQQYQNENLQKLRNVQAQAQQQAQQLQVSLVQQIRALIKGPIDKVAKQRGMQVVMVKQDSIVYSVAGIDITKDVISVAREDGVTKLSTDGLNTTPSTNEPTVNPSTSTEEAKPEPAETGN